MNLIEQKIILVKNDAIRIILILGIAVFVLMGCVPATPSPTDTADGGVISEINAVGKADPAEAIDGSSATSTDDSTISTETEENPTAFIPLPSSETEIPSPSTTSFLMANADAQTDVAGFGNLEGYDATYGTGLENVIQSVRLQTEPTTFLAKLNQKLEHFILSLRGPKGRGNPVIPTAHAQETTCFADESSITELTVNDDGSLDPQVVAQYNQGDQLQLFYFDRETCERSTGVDVSLIDSLLFVANTATSRTGISTDDGSNVYQSDASGNVVNIAATTVTPSEAEGSPYVVQNIFDINYVMASVDADVSTLAYNAGESDFVFQGSETVAAYDYDAGSFTSVTDSSGICAADADTDEDGIVDGCHADGIKNKEEKIYYAVEYDESVDPKSRGYIYELYENTTNRIMFLESGTTDSLGRAITYQSAIAFDVAMEETHRQYFILFDEGNGRIQLFGEIYGLASAELLTTRLNTSLFSDTKDLIIYSLQNEDDSNDGEAFLYTSSDIYFFTYDSVNTLCSEEEIMSGDCDDPNGDATSLTVDTSNPLSIENLESVVINEEGTYAYALADDIISVINLSSREIESTITLTDVIGHDIEINSTALVYTSLGDSNYLMVSSDALQSVIAVELE